MNPQDSSHQNVNAPRPQNAGTDSALPPGADAEERFNQFWKDNGSSIFVCIVVGALIVIGAQTWRYVDGRIEKSTQTQYAHADSSDKLLTFAQDHPKHKLAGAAYLRVASGEFSRAQYKQAASHYTMAADRLAGLPLHERAVLGSALSELLDPTTVGSGVTDLTAILNNQDMTSLTRAEAGFNLALYYLEKHDYKNLAAVAAISDTFGEKNQFAEMTRSLRSQIPEQK
jgi:hypothetical protein